MGRPRRRKRRRIKSAFSFDDVIRRCKLAAGPFDPSERKCDWCGRDLPKRRRRWCSDACSIAVNENHWYSSGRVRTLRKDRFTCRKCGKSRNDKVKVQVNHIKPCKGKHSLAGCWHHLDNLETLCVECHKKETARQRKAGEI